MIKVRYPVSGAVFRADVEGVGPTVVLKPDVLQTQAGLQLCSRSVDLTSFYHFSLI